jgi:hypothetical protein
MELAEAVLKRAGGVPPQSLATARRVREAAAGALGSRR